MSWERKVEAALTLNIRDGTALCNTRLKLGDEQGRFGAVASKVENAAAIGRYSTLEAIDLIEAVRLDPF